MKTRCLITLTTGAALLAGAVSSASDPLPDLNPRDPVVASFERDLGRESTPARPASRDDVAGDPLYGYVNRPLQTPEHHDDREDRK